MTGGSSPRNMWASTVSGAHPAQAIKFSRARVRRLRACIKTTGQSRQKPLSYAAGTSDGDTAGVL